MPVSPEQVRAARALLRLGQVELARRAGVSAVTVRRVEAGSADVAASTVERLQRALEAAGIEFIEGGVRRRPVRPDAEERYQALVAIAERSARTPRYDPNFSEADLYGDDGLPS